MKQAKQKAHRPCEALPEKVISNLFKNLANGSKVDGNFNGHTLAINRIKRRK